VRSSSWKSRALPALVGRGSRGLGIGDRGSVVRYQRVGFFDCSLEHRFVLRQDFSVATAVIDDLRRKLREKFPEAHAALPVIAEEPPPEQPFDPSLFPTAAISEVVGSGVGMLVAGLLGDPAECAALPDFVLVDGGDGFDPASYSAQACSRLLWVRCRTAEEMLKAADLLVRDGNVPFVLLDTCGIARRDLQALAGSLWWRLKLAAEGSGCRLVVMSSFPQVPCAAVRVALTASLGLEDFELPRRDLVGRMRVGAERRRKSA